MTTLEEKSAENSLFNSPDKPYPTSSISNKNSERLQDADEEFIPRPDSLVLPKPKKDKRNKKEKSNLAEYVNDNVDSIQEWRSYRCRKSSSTAMVIPTRTESEFQQIEETHLSKSMPQGNLLRKGEMIEFVADDLQEMIRHSSPHAKTGNILLSD